MLVCYQHLVQYIYKLNLHDCLAAAAVIHEWQGCKWLATDATRALAGVASYLYHLTLLSPHLYHLTCITSHVSPHTCITSYDYLQLKLDDSTFNRHCSEREQVFTTVDHYATMLNDVLATVPQCYISKCVCATMLYQEDWVFTDTVYDIVRSR